MGIFQVFLGTTAQIVHFGTGAKQLIPVVSRFLLCLFQFFQLTPQLTVLRFRLSGLSA